MITIVAPTGVPQSSDTSIPNIELTTLMILANIITIL